MDALKINGDRADSHGVQENSGKSANPAARKSLTKEQNSNDSRERRRRAAAAAKAKPAAKMVRTEGAAAPPDAAERAKCPSCGKNCLFARGDASCCPEYKQHNGVRLDHEDAAPKPIEEVRRLNADGASVVVRRGEGGRTISR